VIRTIQSVGVRVIFRKGLSGWLSERSSGWVKTARVSGATRAEARCGW
jgi:hypothetical protein